MLAKHNYGHLAYYPQSTGKNTSCIIKIKKILKVFDKNEFIYVSMLVIVNR